jgi:hypothetical protein
MSNERIEYLGDDDWQHIEPVEPQQAEMRAYVIQHFAECKHVLIGTKQEAQHKMSELARADFDAHPQEMRDHMAERARVYGHSSAYAFYRTTQRWRVTEAPSYTIAIKP